MQMLTVAFTYDVTPEQFHADNGVEIARVVAEIPGLVWKYWLHDPETRDCLGVYHFHDRVTAKAYAGGEFLRRFGQMPGYTVQEVKLWDLIEENCRVTRAPGVAAN